MSRRSLSSGSSGRSWPSWWCPWSALGCPPTISVNHDDHALDGRHAACRVRGDPAARRRPHELVVGTPSCPRPLCTRAVRSPVAVLIHTPRQFHLRWWPAWSHPSTRGSSCPTPPAATSSTERPPCPSGRGGLLRRPRQRHLNRRAVGPRRHHDARRRAREAEPRPAGGQRPTWARVERHRHHPFGSHPGQRGGRPARVLGSRRWRPRLCGWTRIQHHRLGQTSDTRRCSAGGGTRRRHRLGELVYPPAVHRIGSCRSGRRRGPASEVGRHAAPVLRVVVGTRLHHHAVTVESVRCKSPTEWLRSCWRERDRPMEKLGSHTV